MPNTLIPAPPGAILSRQGVKRPLFALALRDGDSPLPITDMQCWVCEDYVRVGLHDGVAGPRVNGDGRYGYTAMHSDCALRDAAQH